MGCSAFSPDRRKKGQRGCRAGRERQLGRDYNTAAFRTWARAPCYGGGMGRDRAQPWQKNLAPFLRSGFQIFTPLSLHQSQQRHGVLGQTANHAASLPAAAGNPSLPTLQPASRPHMHTLPSAVWSAAFKISRTTSLSSWSGCRKSRTRVKAGPTRERGLELQLNRRKGFCRIATARAGDGGKRLQNFPSPSEIGQHTGTAGQASTLCG